MMWASALASDRDSLPRRFAIVGAAIAVAISLIVGIIQFRVASARLFDMAERNNVALTEVLANTLQEPIARLLEARASGRTDDAVGLVERSIIDRTLRQALSGTHVAKVKIFDTKGVTIYSTDPKQIGEDKRAATPFMIAMGGQVFSDLTYRDQFDAVHGAIFDRDLLFSYIPVRRPGQVEPFGVF